MEGIQPSSGNDVVSAQPHQGNGGDDGSSGGGGGFSEEGGGDRSSSGNRWPKHETLALIKIRSEMDAAFRDSNLKGPLWDNVSRKLSELGIHRSAKKCREKFENVSKYHRRTKEGRSSKSDKIYRFSDQLQALESSTRGSFPPPPPPVVVKPLPVLVGMSNNATVPSTNTATGLDQNNVSPISVAAPAVMAVPPPPVMNHKRTFPFSQSNMSGSTNSAFSSDTSSDDEPPPKKRKWESFFEKLMKEVIKKQEELQLKFIDTLEKRERDRMAREEAWRALEIAKMNQEHERLVQERSIVAAKNAAFVTFLQKMTGQNTDAGKLISDELREKLTDLLSPPQPLSPPIKVIPQQQIYQTSLATQQTPTPPTPTPPPPPPTQQTLPPQPSVAVQPSVVKPLYNGGSGEASMLSPSPSRWPKAEISALITLRTQLDMKYQENVPKGPLWEEISLGMRSLGYNRNAKRCKEKWENINKYYKKMKEGNKKRSEDSKTCPYFDQLDAIYKEKSTPIVAQPENQWPPATMVQEKPTSTPQQQWQLPTVVQETPKQPSSVADMVDQGSMSDEDDYDDDDEDGDDGYEDEDKEDEGNGYEIVANASKVSSMAAV
uniref:trihelix transcription factor DF1-like n=1 Tax=Erigeron canadensis TaxID=72917 RepID=UPI001CB8FE67|nr:trihelix transcription factor DF1-like [Erigeron canadensis]